MLNTRNRLYAASFLMEICYGLFTLAASLTASAAIANRMILGLTGTVHVGTRVLGSIWFGQLSDRIGRRRLLIYSCFFFAAAYLALCLATPVTVFLSYFLAGVANAIFWPLMEAWIGGEETGEDLVGHLGFFGTVFTIGIAAGNLLGGVMGRVAPFVTLAMSAVLLAATGWIIAGTAEVRGRARARTAEASGLDPARRRRFLLAAWCANFATWFTIGLQRFLFTRLCLELALSKTAIGLINALLYFSWALAFLLLIRHRFWTYRIAPLLAFQAVGALAVLLIWFAPSTATFLLGFALFGASAGLTYLSSMYYGQHQAEDKGRKSGWHESVLGLGMLAGSLAGGALAQAFELRTMFLAAACVIAAAMIAAAVAIGRRESPIGSAEALHDLPRGRGGKDIIPG